MSSSIWVVEQRSLIRPPIIKRYEQGKLTPKGAMVVRDGYDVFVRRTPTCRMFDNLPDLTAHLRVITEQGLRLLDGHRHILANSLTDGVICRVVTARQTRSRRNIADEVVGGSV